MPECKFGLNEKIDITKKSNSHRHGRYDSGSTKNNNIDIDDIQFHPCVRLGQRSRQGGIRYIYIYILA